MGDIAREEKPGNLDRGHCNSSDRGGVARAVAQHREGRRGLKSLLFSCSVDRTSHTAKVQGLDLRACFRHVKPTVGYMFIT